MPVIWLKPTVPGAAQFAEWDGAIFGFVRKMPDGRWRCSVFPDGKSEHGVGVWLETEVLAKKMVERWAAVNHGRIKPQARKRMPHEGKE